MARARLRDIPLVGRTLEAARLDGSVVIKAADGTDATTTIYAGPTGTTAINSYGTASFNAAAGGLDGWVDSGRYIVSTANGNSQYVVAAAGDETLEPAGFSLIGYASNMRPEQVIGAATTTSQTIRFVRVKPTRTMNVIKVSTAANAAAATITNCQIGVYSFDGTNLNLISGATTLVATTGLWDTANTTHRTAFAGNGTITVQGGRDYFVGLLVNASTPGSLYGFATAVATQPQFSTPEAEPWMYTLASQTSLPASTALAGLTAAFNLVPWVALTEI